MCGGQQIHTPVSACFAGWLGVTTNGVNFFVFLELKVQTRVV